LFDGEVWNNVWKKLHEIVSEVKDFKEQVFQGDKYPPDKYPCAFVCPGRIDSRPATMHESRWSYTFEIGIGVHGEDDKKTTEEAYRLANLIVKGIFADRKLTVSGSALVQNLEIPTIIPNWRRRNRGLETRWIGVLVVCQRKM